MSLFLKASRIVSSDLVYKISFIVKIKSAFVVPRWPVMASNASFVCFAVGIPEGSILLTTKAKVIPIDGATQVRQVVTVIEEFLSRRNGQ